MHKFFRLNVYICLYLEYYFVFIQCLFPILFACLSFRFVSSKWEYQTCCSVHGWLVGGVVIRGVMIDHHVGLIAHIIDTTFHIYTTQTIENAYIHRTIHQSTCCVADLLADHKRVRLSRIAFSTVCVELIWKVVSIICAISPM